MPGGRGRRGGSRAGRGPGRTRRTRAGPRRLPQASARPAPAATSAATSDEITRPIRRGILTRSAAASAKWNTRTMVRGSTPLRSRGEPHARDRHRRRRGSRQPERRPRGAICPSSTPRPARSSPSVAQASADDVREAVAARPRGPARLGGARLRRPRQGPEARAEVDDRQHRPDRRARSFRRPARPTRTPCWPRWPTRPSAFGFWAKRAKKYLADEKVRTSNPFVLGRRLRVRYAPAGVDRGDRAVELPAHQLVRRLHPGARRRQHRRPEARQPDAAHLAADARGAARERPARGRLPGGGRPRRLDRRRPHRRRRLRSCSRARPTSARR